jgi:hypothetical protein
VVLAVLAFGAFSGLLGEVITMSPAPPRRDHRGLRHLFPWLLELDPVRGRCEHSQCRAATHKIFMPGGRAFSRSHVQPGAGIAEAC